MNNEYYEMSNNISHLDFDKLKEDRRKQHEVDLLNHQLEHAELLH